MVNSYNGECLLTDLDKVVDFLTISKQEFLDSYSYLKEQDYIDMTEVFNDNKLMYLSTWWNCAEKLVAGLVTYSYSVSGEELKTVISNYAVDNLTKEELYELYDLCAYS